MLSSKVSKSKDVFITVHRVLDIFHFSNLLIYIQKWELCGRDQFSVKVLHIPALVWLNIVCWEVWFQKESLPSAFIWILLQITLFSNVQRFFIGVRRVILKNRCLQNWSNSLPDCHSFLRCRCCHFLKNCPFLLGHHQFYQTKKSTSTLAAWKRACHVSLKLVENPLSLKYNFREGLS